MPNYSACSWCHKLFVQDSYKPFICVGCGHRADVPSALCDCPECCLKAALIPDVPGEAFELPDIPMPPLQLGSRMNNTTVLLTIFADGIGVTICENDKPKSGQVIPFTRQQMILLAQEVIKHLSPDELKDFAEMIGQRR